MTTFWILAALATALTLVAVLWPLLRRRPAAGGDDRTGYDVRVYRDQLAEVDRDLERGLIDTTQAEAARTEIQRRMLAAGALDEAEKTRAEAEAKTPHRGRNLALAAVLAVVVPAGAIGLYLDLGRPGTPDRPLAGRDLDSERNARQQAEMEQLLTKLKQRLAENPEDVRGWLLLARSYGSMERFEDAARAYDKAMGIAGRRPEILVSYAEALVMAAGDSLPEEALAAFREVQAEDPTDPRPYFYLGTAKAARGDMKGAIQDWTNLLAVSPPDAPWRADIEKRITMAAERAGLDPAAIEPTVEAAAPAPSQEQMDAAAEMTPAEREEMIRGMVERLAQRLEDNPDDPEGWRRLAKAYEVLGETEKAAEARAEAEKRTE